MHIIPSLCQKYKSLLATTVTALLLVSCTSTEKIDQLLAEVWTKDQSVRYQLMELTNAVSVEGRTELIDSLIQVVENVERIDKENIAVIDSLLQEGLPEGLSAASYKTIWIVIDHASLEKQEQYLPLIEHMALEGLIDLSEYATLYDRIAMQHNRPQRFGSQAVQFGSPDSLMLYIWPVEDANGLDSLRNTVNMSSILEYLQRLTESSGIEAQYDPQMTVDEINRIRQYKD